MFGQEHGSWGSDPAPLLVSGGQYGQWRQEKICLTWRCPSDWLMYRLCWPPTCCTQDQLPTPGQGESSQIFQYSNSPFGPRDFSCCLPGYWHSQCESNPQMGRNTVGLRRRSSAAACAQDMGQQCSVNRQTEAHEEKLLRRAAGSVTVLPSYITN